MGMQGSWRIPGRYVNHGTATSLADLGTGSMLWWVMNPSYVQQAGLQLMWSSKNTGVNHRFDISYQPSQIIQFEYGGGTGGGSASTAMSVNLTNARMRSLKRPWCVAFVWSQGGALPFMYFGDASTRLEEPRIYTTRAAGSNGSTPHSDASSPLVIGQFGAGAGSAGCPNTVLSVQLWNRALSYDELMSAKQQLTPWMTGCVLATRYGDQALPQALDESSAGNHGTIVGGMLPQRDPRPTSNIRTVFGQAPWAIGGGQ